MEIAPGTADLPYETALWTGGSDWERQLGDSSDPDYWNSAAFAPDAYPTLADTTGYHNRPFVTGNGHDAGWEDTEGFFDVIAAPFKAVASVAKAVGSGVASVAKAGYGLASQGTNLLQQGLKAISNNPLWNIVQTGASFIPGVGTAVSAGMAGAAAIGRGESLKNIGLSAARNAIPGGPAVQAAFDVAHGLLGGKNVTDAVLQAARSQVPGGAAGQAAFDAAVAIGKGAALNDVAIQQIRKAVPGGVLGQQTFDKILTGYRQNAGGRMIGSFPGLTAAARSVAQTIQQSPFARQKTVRDLAGDLSTAPANVRSAIAELMNRWKGQRLYTAGDVGDYDSAESCCVREGISTGDTGRVYNTGDTGAHFGSGRRIAVRVAMTRPHVQALFQTGRPQVKQQILAHGLFPRIAHNTGELAGDGGWIIRSGDSPFAIAQKLTGQGARWKEILPVNPTLKVVQKGGTTLVQPFNPGQRITIPTSWLGTAAPAPRPNTPPIITTTPPSTIPGAVPPRSAPTVTAASLLKMPLIKRGSSDATSGGAVSVWQAGIKPEMPTMTIDGKFGPQTEELTRMWQGRHVDASGAKLTVDGVVGPKTWSALAAVMAGAAPPSSIPTPIPIPIPTPAMPPPVGPAVPSSADQVSLAAIQAMLASFYQFHGGEVGMGDFSSSSTPVYGSDPANDLAGTWSKRSHEAFLGFQNWRNAHPVAGVPPLPETGDPDQISVNALQSQNAADLKGATGIPIPPMPQLPPVIPVSTKPPPVPGSTVPPKAPPVVVPPTRAAAGGGSDLGPVLAVAALALVGLSMAGRKRAA
jgi:hypothetical protein